jgi:hypothetical protein
MSAELEDELWFVELPDGRTRAMSLEELDAAYQAGQIEESTRLRKDGETEWTTLAVVAGLGEDDADPFGATVPSAPPPPVSTGPSSLAPYALSVASTPSMMPTPTPGPIMLDDDDVPYAAMQKSSKGLVFGLIGGVLVAVGVTVFFVAKANAPSAEAVAKAMPVAAANAVPPPAAVDPPPAADSKPKLSEDQRKLLAEQDKKREAENARKAKDRAERIQNNAGPSRRGPRGKTSEPFVKGGSKFDPLNGNL